MDYATLEAQARKLVESMGVKFDPVLFARKLARIRNGN